HRDISRELFRLDFAWAGPAPRPGQFFLIKPKRSAVFLGRPISVAAWEPEREGFLIARRGRGTGELDDLYAGEEAELTGPLGNAWGDFPPPVNRESADAGVVALVGGGAGIAPLRFLAAELPPRSFDFYAGFRFLRGEAEAEEILGPAPRRGRETVVAAEQGGGGRPGRITGFIDPARYAAIYACGPEAMLKALSAAAAAAGRPCFVSLERPMACAVGACLGCTVRTRGGNRRCCTEGPIFDAQELIFDD
ncbi:MAG: dihydroorotate dehydrogenase electron transfer subunit, partial [Spirochaetaceae bacterium]|nr:dihydroorotate dehydrogenase electron transfer subunit [Spirochaetaceae bacterium]